MRFLCETIEMHVTHVIDKIDLSTDCVNVVMLTKIISKLLTTQPIWTWKSTENDEKILSNSYAQNCFNNPISRGPAWWSHTLRNVTGRILL